ncbi:trypsin-like peptidase domain-containing protein [Fuerstiella marisgermanici]|uniref:Serine protease HtrA n=1 Tax=Fuerstiella marisgermanici TaxID=1891926 RepID=A0A1P8WCM5_9PLAN|nr:trypsin-like peptidase domain-containing protein [Fuerstiella marisgermanici]APZ91784.1 Putative serine protease HtrA [Fuerstiella marisgermanici]
MTAPATTTGIVLRQVAALAALTLPAASIADAVEPPYVTVVANALPSCVRIVSRSDHSSGVLVSPAGHILTVAHGLHSNDDQAEVVTPRGGRLVAHILHRDAAADVALLKLQMPTSGLPDGLHALTEFASQDRSELSPHTVVLSLGFPARDTSTAEAVVRLGRIEAATDSALRTSCTLTVGDSGGPLLTTDGVLIGVHQKIGLGRSSNLHIPLQRCREVLAAALKSEDVSLSDLDNTRPVSVIQPVASAAAKKQLQQRSVRICGAADDRVIAFGTRLSDTLVATKLSLLPPGEAIRVQFMNDEFADASLLTSGQPRDLAILQLLPGNTAPPIIEPDANSAKPSHPNPSQLDIGTVLFAGNAAQTTGIVARVKRDEPRGAPSLGCTLSQDGQLVKVDRVTANSAASEAGVKPQDRLQAINAAPVRDLGSVAKALQTLEPGDRLSVTVVRVDQTTVGFGQLRHRPNKLLDRTEFLDGRAGRLSLRRTGFQNVIQHDAALEPAEMGGPLVLADGTIVGINIARRSREAVLAIPIADVLELAKLKRLQP